jgi:hypothetical protein
MSFSGVGWFVLLFSYHCHFPINQNGEETFAQSVQIA